MRKDQWKSAALVGAVLLVIAVVAIAILATRNISMTSIAGQLENESETTQEPTKREATPRPTSASAEVEKAAVSAEEPADLGPWAPGEGWLGENFEATCNEDVCASTHLQLWWPQGDTPWDVDEVHTILPPGLSITVIKGAGRGWEYPQGYSSEDIQERILDDLSRRANDTSLYGFVSVDELIELGLVEVRFDRRNGDFELEIESVYP